MTLIQEALIGRQVTKVEVSPDREKITFTTTTGNVVLSVYSDCCSYTWIEEISDLPALFGTISEVNNLDMPDLGSLSTQYCPAPDEVQYYGLQIITEHGRCTIDYRNSSNGYYGGSLDVERNEHILPA